MNDPTGVAALTSFDYDAVGQVTKITRPNGAYLQYTWDDARRLTKVQDNTGASVEYDRDAMGGNTARRIKNSGGTVLLSQTATFDELGRFLTFVGAATQTWTYGYDKTDNLVSVTDPRTNVYQRAFDPLNRLIRETDEETAQVNLTRNGKDEITAYADPRSLTTSYVRNGFGDVIQRASPDAGTAVTVVNALGKPTQITDGRGVVANLTYDNAGRLLTKQYPAATAENITYTWDSTVGGNMGVGRLTRIDDASGSVEWTYDALGRVTQEKNWHRHYDPTLGRYLQPDPLEFVDGPGIYAYAGLSPLMYIDPSGERITKERLRSIIEACILAWRLFTGDPNIKTIPRNPLPPMTRPTP